MADATSAPLSGTPSSVSQRPRRSSRRKSLSDCGLPPGYLEALEVKRRTLDESIHKFIASKEREYKQYEKELKQQAKREESHAQRVDAQGSSTDPASVEQVGDATDKRSGGDSEHQESREATLLDDEAGDNHQQEDFQGVFTPEYLSLLNHDELHRATSETANKLHKAVPALTRHNSDPTQASDLSRANRFMLSHRTSSSGSSMDGKLISAMKHLGDTSHPKRKRVSIAVGDAIVAPSDNVPVALHGNSSSSHSHSRARKPIALGWTTNEQAFSNAPAPDRTDQEQSPPGATQKQTPTLLPPPLPPTMDDVGDMFDLEDTDDAHELHPDQDAESSQDSLNETFGGRVQPRALLDDSSIDEPQLEPDQHADSGDEELQEVPLTPITGAASAVQPAESGFRRPSVLSDPVYRGRQSNQSTNDDEIYSSSYSRPISKGSFTSGSMGESFMAKNAAAMLDMRARQQQQQQQGQQSERQHRASHSGTALPVR